MNKQQSPSETEIRSEDTFTLSARYARIRIKDIQSVLRLAIYKANNKRRVRTYAYFFGDGLLHKRSRSFHVAITRPLNEDERFSIEQMFRETCAKADWGNPDVFFRWGVRLQDKQDRFSTGYLEQHPQKYFVKVSNGAEKGRSSNEE